MKYLNVNNNPTREMFFFWGNNYREANTFLFMIYSIYTDCILQYIKKVSHKINDCKYNLRLLKQTKNK